jgi:hypothetical protein
LFSRSDQLFVGVEIVLSMSADAGHKNVKDSNYSEGVPDFLRVWLDEYSSKIVQQNALQHNAFLEVLDSKISQHVQFKFSELKDSLLADITQSTKAMVCEAMSEVSEKLTAAMREEVSKLDDKVSTQLNMLSGGCSKCASSSSNSQVSLSSCSSGSCAHDTHNHETVEIRVQKWPCPFCPAILKHEHSFYDHMSTLMTRIHELPVHSTGPKRIKRKKCLFDITNPEHSAMLRPWYREGVSYWDQVTAFMTELFSRVHPGSAFALLDNNPCCCV